MSNNEVPKIGYCCVCGCKAKGLVLYGEFICFACHHEATGERPPKAVSLRKRNHPVNRQKIRDNLIADRLKNKIKEKQNEK